MTSADTSLPGPLPAYREKPRQAGRLPLMLLFAALAVVGVAGALFLAVGAGDVVGSFLSLVLALAPVPVVWFCYWWLDRYEPEPRRYKFAAFVWGAVVATSLALVLQVLSHDLFGFGPNEIASFVAPVTEEPAKGLFLVLTLVRLRRAIDGVLDGLILAGIVGLGFACVENVGYYAQSVVDGGLEGLSATFVVRGVFSPFAHPLFTSAFGIGIGLAVSRRSTAAKWACATLGMAVSIGLHFLWNASLSYGGGGGFLLVYAVLSVALFVLAVVAIVVRVRQVRILERSLASVAERGWIHRDEIPYLARFNHRRAARRYAREHHGAVAHAAVVRYQRLATEMSFRHEAVMQGRGGSLGVERTYALLDAMYGLRPWLRFPPALAPVHRG